MINLRDKILNGTNVNEDTTSARFQIQPVTGLHTAPKPGQQADVHPAQPLQLEEVDHFPGEGYRVTLFNDDFHTVDEVVGQLIKALKCPLDVAVEIMLQAHTRGSAVVIIAEQATADRVAMILREILLVVSVELL